MVTATVQAGNPDRAESFARTLTDPFDQAEAITSLAVAVAQTETAAAPAG